MSAKQRRYIDVLAGVCLHAQRGLERYENQREYYLGRLEAAEDIAQYLGVKARMHKHLKKIEVERARGV